MSSQALDYNAYVTGQSGRFATQSPAITQPLLVEAKLKRRCHVSVFCVVSACGTDIGAATGAFIASSGMLNGACCDTLCVYIVASIAFFAAIEGCHAVGSVFGDCGESKV